MTGVGSAQAAAGLAAQVASLVEQVYRRLEQVAEEVAQVGGAARDGRLTEAALQPLAELLAGLVAEDAVVVGTGFVADAGAVSGHERFMSWWQRAPGGGVARLRLNFDPASVDVYDYLQMEWFQHARSGRRRVVYGPYVDYSGSELYILTMTVPVRVGDGFAWVVGADLAATALERRLVPVLRRSAAEAVLVSAERRVLAANSPRWLVGTRLP